MSTLIAAVVVAGALTCPVAGQTETVELQFKYQRGETLFYHAVESTVVSTQLPGTQTTVTRTREGRLAFRVLDVDPDGAMVVEGVAEDLRVTTDGRAADEVDSPVIAKIRPDGTFVEVQASEELSALLDFTIGFPSHPLRVGDTWGTPFDRQLLGATVEVNPTFTLAGVDRTDAGRAARISSRFEGTVKNFNLPRRQDTQVQVTGTARGSGEELWSVERGRLQQSRSETSLDIHVTVTTGGRTVRGHVTAHATTRLDGLPQDKVVVAAVGPDALIAPGKAVGVFALGQRMDDLVSKLGSPGQGASAPDPTMWGADRGFRSVAASWSNRLVAYLDPQNQSAVLGLGVVDRRFRTDKGLGFGSSRGAVLFAHGMSPTRLNMAFGSGSSDTVQVLIYNDEGIAYGITAEDKPSGVTRPRAPLGAVRWIVIFPPGNAGKIFPLP